MIESGPSVVLHIAFSALMEGQNSSPVMFVREKRGEKLVRTGTEVDE